MPTNNEIALVDRVRKLKLRGATFASFDILPMPGVISSVMTPKAGWDLWQELVDMEEELGLVPVVIDAEMAELEDGQVVALGASGDVTPEELALAVAEERRKTAQRNVDAFLDEREDGRLPWQQWLAERTNVPVQSLSGLTWPELHARFAEMGTDCPEANPMAAYLAEIDAAVDASYLGPVEHDTPLFADSPPGGRVVEQVRLLLLATTSNELPIVLQMGGFNDCPMPHEHALMLARWSRQYGARIAFYGHDIIEIVVDRPPRTLAELRRLTREHFIYCPDVVDQGVGSTSELARLLARSTAWYFWWD